MTTRERDIARDKEREIAEKRREVRGYAYRDVAATKAGRVIFSEIVREVFRRGFDKTANNAFAEGRRDIALELLDNLRLYADIEDVYKILFGED